MIFTDVQCFSTISTYAQICSMIFKHFQRFVNDLCPCVDFEIEEAKRKSCCVSRSFGKKVESLDKLKESITTHCLNAAEKIRNDEQTTKSITVYIRTSPFDKNRKYYSNSITIDLPVSTNNSLELVKTAINGLTKICQS